MKKQVVLISKGSSFMVNAIEKNLRDANYEFERIEPNVTDINAHQDDADIFVFYLGDFIDEIAETLVYIKDICTENDKLLVLIGNATEIAQVEEHIPSAIIAARFPRPFDMKKLIGELDYMSQANDDIARRKNILLVDDDGAFLKMLKGWLSTKYRVTIVTSGAQALMYIANNKPDLILLDYEMPVTSGPQVLEMIRTETKVDRIPVIFLTGKGDRESVIKVVSLKPDGYLLKSMERNQLVAAIDEFFEKRKYHDLHKLY